MKRLRFESRGDVIFLLVLACIAVLAVLVQQLFPSTSLVPFARVNGNLVRIHSKDTIIPTYKAIEEKTITIHIKDKTYTYRNVDLGFHLNEQRTLKPYYVESRLRRLLPFSMLVQILRYQTPVYESTRQSMLIITAEMADDVYVEPKDALIRLDGQSATVVASSRGTLLYQNAAADAILQAVTEQKDSLTLTPKSTDPDIPTSELEQAVATFSNSLPDSLTIHIENTSEILPKQTMLSWLTYIKKDGKPSIMFDDTLVEAYANSIAKGFTEASPPTTTLVSLTDGHETGRVAGVPGKSINGNKLKEQITDAVDHGEQSITAQLVDVASPIKYERTYTKSPAGLQDLLGQITEGKEISIRYIDINDRGWDLGSRQTTRSRMASTYKMFVLYSTLKRVDEGSLKLTDPINDQTYDSCLQTIIIDSNNECSIAIAERLGWGTIQNEGKALGATGLDWKDELYGTVSDAAVIPTKLARGEILSESSRNYMLDLMKRQKFRNGIPAGTPHEVADKVGFINNWLNDAAIVYAPNMTYVLAIYTEHESWSTIAEITRQIESLAL